LKGGTEAQCTLRYPGIGTKAFEQNAPYTKAVLLALNSKKTVARVFVDGKASRQISAFRALILAEVVNSLLLATAKRDTL
jgi:hypothetical protein